MKIPQTTLEAINTSFSKRFRTAYQDTPEFWQKIAMEIPSSTKLNTYGWMARIGIMRKWLGERKVNNLNAYAYALLNEPYEFTVGVLRDDIEDDEIGVYQPLMGEMGRVSKKWKDQMAKTALQSGTSVVTFDGVPFFSTSHPLSGTNQSNLFASTALTAANLDAVRTAMGVIKGEDGEIMAITDWTLVVPPALEFTANTIIKANLIPAVGVAASVDNQQKDRTGLIVIPELNNEPTVWYLLATAGEVKPLVIQTRRNPSPPETPRDTEFWRREIVWGTDARGAAGYGPWWLAARAAA